MAITPRSLLHRWQSGIRCHAFNEHDHLCCHPITSGWWVQTVPNPFAGYTEPTATGGGMPEGRHVRPRPNLLTRLKVVIARVVTSLSRPTPPHQD